MMVLTHFQAGGLNHHQRIFIGQQEIILIKTQLLTGFTTL